MSEVLDSATGQLGLDLGETKAPQRYTPDIDSIRAELGAVIACLRAATDAPPWDARTTRLQKTIFPQMSNWLPEAERDSMRAAFAAEMARIDAISA